MVVLVLRANIFRSRDDIGPFANLLVSQGGARG